MPSHIEYFNVQTARIAITVEKYTANNNTFVKTERFRSFPTLGHPSLNEWISDTRLICNHLSQTNLDYEDFHKALIAISRDHIRRYGRLIDNDLYNYIDETLLIINGLVGLDGSVFNINDAKQEWLVMQDVVFRALTSHIWVHKFSNSPLQSTQLIPLREAL